MMILGHLWHRRLQESLPDQEWVSPVSGPATPPGRDTESVPRVRLIVCLKRRETSADFQRIFNAQFYLLRKNVRFSPENSGGKSFEPCTDLNLAHHAETCGAAASPSR